MLTTEYDIFHELYETIYRFSFYRHFEKRRRNIIFPAAFLHAADLGRAADNGEFKPLVFNEDNREFTIPHGTMGSRWDEKENGICTWLMRRQETI